jgi:acetyl/propionyl-CoA carboxylase alpha subunit
VLGVTTNALSLSAILEHPAFLAGETPTSFLEDHPEVLAPSVPGNVRDQHLTIAAAALFAGGAAWRNVHGAPETLRVTYRDGAREVSALLGHAWARSGSRLVVVRDLDAVDDDGATVIPHAAQALAARGAGVSHHGVLLERTGHAGDDGFVEHRVEIDGVRTTVYLRLDPTDPVENVTVDSDGWLTTVTVLSLSAGTGHDATTGAPTTPVPGTVTHVAVAAGDVVEAGTALVVLEAMKMEHTIRADVSGTITDVHVTVGQSVDAHTIVATLTPDADSS